MTLHFTELTAGYYNTRFRDGYLPIALIENTCCALQQDIDRQRNEFKLLEGKIEDLQAEKAAVEDELEVMKKRNQELEEQVRQNENNGSNEGKEEEEDKLLQLMIENSVLECEKKKAGSDVEIWKSKCNEMQLVVLELKKELASRGGDSISTKTQWGLQDESNNLAQSTAHQGVYNMAKVDEIKNKAGLDANSNFCDGEI